MRLIIIICLGIIICEKGFCQDTLHRSDMQAAVKDLYKDSISLRGYKKLPKYIRNYMDQQFEGKFRLPKHRFNATDMGAGRSRKYMYAVGSKEVYAIGYEHGGLGYHCHAIIFRTTAVR